MKFRIGQQLIDKIRGKKIKSDFLPIRILNTSLSDNGDYPQFCLKASLDDEIFKNFKQYKVYNEILEHVGYNLGLKYYDEIKKLDVSLLKDNLITEFKKNDKVGNPILFNFNEIENISGSTLRYIHVLAKLKQLFGSLNNKKICEIGVGYGGQCRILSSFFKLKSYTLIDLKPVLGLAQKYLDNYPLNTVIEYKTMNELSYDKEYDLVISNYAFSEISKEFQKIYLDKVIKKSKSGFMIMNQIAPDGFEQYSQNELLKEIPNSQIIEEIPLTYHSNYIITWGSNG